VHKILCGDDSELPEFGEGVDFGLTEEIGAFPVIECPQRIC
jgi:hypothetical protein